MKGLGIVVILALSTPRLGWAASGEDVSYSPKLSLRTANGLLEDVGLKKGSAITLAGVNALYLHYASADTAIGLGYRANFDWSKGTVPTYGFFSTFRKYISGEGTHYQSEANDLTIERHDALAFYWAAEFAQSSYYLGSNPAQTTDTLTGTFFGLNGALGMDLRMNRHFELNVEANFGIISFAQSDNRYRLMGRLINAGVSYVW